MKSDVLRIDGLKVSKARLALPHEAGRHISQAKLAERAGLHWVTVSNIERGKSPNATMETLGKLAGALNVDPMSLVDDDAQGDRQPFRDAA